MSLRFKYFTFIIILHALLALLLYFVVGEKKILFLVSEAFLLVSLFISYKIYRSFIYPIELMNSGKIAIKEEDFTIKYNKTGAKEIDGLLDVYNNMIDHLRLERTKTEEQAYFLENLIENSPIGMIIMDYDQRIEIINKKALEIIIKENAVGMTLPEINHPLFNHFTELSTNQDEIITIDGMSKYKCRIHELMHKGFPRQFVIIQELTAEILKAEKEAYGKVIRMMAHEVNNSTGAINSILETVNEFTKGQDQSDTELLDSLNIAIDRNKKLGQFTNNFAEMIRLPAPKLVKINLIEVLNQSINLYRSKAQQLNIDISSNFENETFYIIGDAIQLEQVLSNILKNAIESIQEKKQSYKQVENQKGSITISSHSNPAKITITDNGVGIDGENKDKLFSPFFSTKTDGQGIGLMLIREILNAHGFKYQLSTDENSGETHFEILV